MTESPGRTVAAPSGAAARWLVAQQRLADRIAHEIRNALNGAVLNVEVVRSRAGPQVAGADATLAPFAEAASSQLSTATELVEAFLALARAGRSPVDLDVLARNLVRLYGAIATQAGGRISYERASAGSVECDVSPDVARAVLATILDASTSDEGAGDTSCRLTRTGGTITFALRGGDSSLPRPVLDAARESGIRCETDGTEIRIQFPASDQGGAPKMQT